MTKFRKLILVMAIIKITLITGCNNQSVHCKEILDTVRKAELITDDAKNGNRQELMIIAKGLDQLATELEALKFSDQKLQIYQGSFVKSYRDVSQALRSTVAVIDRPNSDTLSSALKSLEKTTIRNQSLVEEIRTVCPAQ